LEKHQFYSTRIEFHNSRVEFFRKRENYLSFVRLASFVLFLFVIVYSFQLSAIAGIVAIFLSIILFGIILNIHLKAGKTKQKHQYLSEINTAENDYIKGNYSRFPNGSEYDEKDHPYTYDLDIFGNYSLFQYINRSNTQPGALTLANWLKKQAPLGEIQLRQEAVKELSEKIDWRQELRTIFYHNPLSVKDPQPLTDWSKEPQIFKTSGRLALFLWMQTAITLTCLILSFIGLPEVWITLCILINIGVYYNYIKRINTTQSQLSKIYSTLESYSEIINLTEKESFSSTKLQGLKNKFSGNIPASIRLKQLASILKKLDLRLNILIGIPLNLFFFWDIHQCLKLEKWKTANKDNLTDWFSAMAEFDALSSIANTLFNNPDWVFPEVKNDYFIFEGKNIGHPLIASGKRVENNFSLNGKGKIALITGSNMSGKSTFLRTCAVNGILAMAGAPVCADKLTISYVKVISSMRISDSLEDNTSSFYAELKKLAQIIKEIENHENVFILLDEILRGTNSNDRHTGSIAIIKQLIKNKASALLATHDLGLSYLSEEMPNHIDIYNFDVKIQGEELFFDYKINSGICKSLNASILMKKMGIEI
jgi:ABC-type multidrug transport system fused ATPase/permease subunit